MSDDALANLFASKFIARPDAKAQQSSNGKWYVDTDTGKHDGKRLPWRRADLNDHISGKRTFGHYLLSKESQCKLFAFDVDLQKTGLLPSTDFLAEAEPQFYEEQDLRAAWLNRAHPARSYIKYQFKMMAHLLMRAISSELGIPCTAAYSGGKGIHVYAFTGLIAAEEAREGAQIVLDSIGTFEPHRGENFFRSTEQGFDLFEIEVFPKQGSLDGKDLGNLMRLPLGKNLKAPKEPAFFIDMTGPLAQMAPADPIKALTSENPWV